MFTRREFTLGATVLGGLAIHKASQGVAWAQGSANPIVTRRSVGIMAPDDADLAAYSNAMEKMRALPESDPRNWRKQAEIHQKFCPHGNWYFLPWHRAYLTAFERICRDLSGKSDFALPYWDWTVDRKIPRAFREGPLSHSRPGFGADDSLPDSAVGQSVINRIMTSPEFELFGSERPRRQNSSDKSWLRRRGSSTELEFGPHNTIHSTLSGDMGTFLSPIDPIFWLHHCNVDRLWTRWNLTNSNSSEKFWLDMDLSSQFVKPDGSSWDLKVRDVAARSTDSLRDRYNFGPLVVAPRTEKAEFGELLGAEPSRTFANQPMMFELPRSGHKVKLAGAQNDKSASKIRPLSIPVSVGTNIKELVSSKAVPDSSSPGGITFGWAIDQPPKQRILATIHDISMPEDISTGVRVFANCDYLSPATPISDPHYVGSFAFFGHGQPSITVDLTEALTKVGRAGELQGDEIVVQLMPFGVGKEGATVIKPKNVEVLIL